jgi:hypothetical protein
MAAEPAATALGDAQDGDIRQPAAAAEPMATASTPARVSPTRPTPSRDAAPAPRAAAGPLSGNQRQMLASMLREVSSPPRVELSWVATTAAYERAKELWSALEQAGWSVTPAGGILTPSTPGVTSITTSILSDATLLLRTACESAGIEVSIVLEPDVPADQVKLMIAEGT